VNPVKGAKSEALLRKFHLWSDLPETCWQQLVTSMGHHTFTAGERIFPAPQTDSCLCVLWIGQARVFANSPDPAHAALLRTMGAGAVFGVHCIFNSEIPPQSEIVAHKDCTVVTIPAALWEQVLSTNPPVMAHYVRFLTQRIEFLNQKIQYLTAGCTERRLALYLISQIPQDDVAVRLDISAVSLADLLDVGRASLYRAMDRLTEDGFLIRRGHEYALHDREHLLAHYA
jgi:CRP-like cAMP-binding protein